MSRVISSMLARCFTEILFTPTLTLFHCLTHFSYLWTNLESFFTQDYPANVTTANLIWRQLSMSLVTVIRCGPEKVAVNGN